MGSKTYALKSGRSYHKQGKPEKVKSGHTAPTPGLNDVVFIFGSTKDAAEFAETKSKLSRYVGTQTWSYASKSALAMETMMAPVYHKPTRPVREYESAMDSSGIVTINVPRVPLIDDYIFKLDCKEFSRNKKLWKMKEAAWKENNAKMFNLVLLHCPRKLKEVLKTLTKWDAARLGQDAITLLGLIQDVTHKHDETKQGTMALVKSFLEFATTFQETGQTVDAYSTLFCARVDMVNAHGGNARFHLKIGSNHLKALVAKGGKAALSDFMADEQKAMTATARASACEEFLACFLSEHRTTTDTRG